MKTKLPESITTIEQAQKFLSELHANDETFHPDDNAHTIEWHTAKVSVKECDKLNKLMGDISELKGFDPCEYLLGLETSETRTSTNN